MAHRAGLVFELEPAGDVDAFFFVSPTRGRLRITAEAFFPEDCTGVQRLSLTGPGLDAPAIVEGECPTLAPDFGLPAGAFTIEVSAGDRTVGARWLRIALEPRGCRGGEPGCDPTLPDTPTLETQDVVAMDGTATVPVVLASPPGPFGSFEFEIGFDPDVLTYESVERSPAAAAQGIELFDLRLGANRMAISGFSIGQFAIDAEGDGRMPLLNLQFAVAEGALGETTAEFEGAFLMDADNQRVELETQSSQISLP